MTSDLSTIVTRPSTHGLILDYTHADGRRVHVRVFTYRQEVRENVEMEWPADLREEEVVDLLKGAAGVLGGGGGAEGRSAADKVAELAGACKVCQGWGWLKSPAGRPMAACWACSGMGVGDGHALASAATGEKSDAAQRVPTHDGHALASAATEKSDATQRVPTRKGGLRDE